MIEAEPALVIGASGLIGSHLLRAGRRRGLSVSGTYHANTAPGLEPLDLGRFDAVRSLLQARRPSLIFLAAARANVEAVEEDAGASHEVNVGAVERLAELLAQSRGARLVYFSSDYVFDGESGPYREDDEPNPLSVYGTQKLTAERAILAALPGRSLVLRVTGVYGVEPRGKNFALRCVRTLQEGESMRVPTDQQGNPSFAEDVAEAAWSLAQQGVAGLLHLGGPDWVSRYRFAREVADIFELNPGLVRPVTTAELNQRALRPLRAGMRSDRANTLLGRPLVGIRTGLERLKEQLST